MTEIHTSEGDGTSLSAVPGASQAKERLAQVILLVVVFSVPALFCLYTGSISDPDLWWHLRSAEWIAQHHAVPHTDPFSSFGAGKPWAAYSWLFELVILFLFNHLGLVGVLLYTTVMVIAITIALYHLVQRLNADFSFSVLVAFVASLSLGTLHSPRPWHFTILFFILELDILMQARRTGRTRELLWLPLIFAIWPDFHIQFIDGLLLLLLAAAESIASIWWLPARTRLRLRWIVPISLLSVVATLCNPYGWGIYKVAYGLASQTGIIDTIGELRAIPFRTVSDYCALFMALAAAAALARSNRVRVFEMALFAIAVFLSFRSQRDIWIVSTAAAASIAACIETGTADRQKLPRYGWPTIVAATALFTFAGFRVMHIDNARLNARLAEDLPVQAAAFIRAKNLPGPLYNDYVWGGYLMWSLRQPVSPKVSIDGRAMLHGTARMDRFGQTWMAAPDWASDTELQHARLVVGRAKVPLVQLLRVDPDFQLVYEDKLAAVFIHR